MPRRDCKTGRRLHVHNQVRIVGRYSVVSKERLVAGIYAVCCFLPDQFACSYRAISTTHQQPGIYRHARNHTLDRPARSAEQSRGHEPSPRLDGTAWRRGCMGICGSKYRRRLGQRLLRTRLPEVCIKRIRVLRQLFCVSCL